MQRKSNNVNLQSRLLLLTIGICRHEFTLSLSKLSVGTFVCIGYKFVIKLVNIFTVVTRNFQRVRQCSEPSV